MNKSSNVIVNESLPLESNITERNIAACEFKYKKHLLSFDEKPEIPFLAFLFESLEAKRIKITQEIIDSIHYIGAKSKL